MNTKFIDLTGQKIGKWTALRRVHTEKGPRWLCRCECGVEKFVLLSHLRSGHSKSCHACYGRSKVTHGLSRINDGNPPIEYTIWIGIMRRCFKTKIAGYARYGGRGITVCDRWRHSFENFFADMGPRPTPKHSVDRIDNDGNYEPSNCRWATKKEQSRNMRTNRLLELHGTVKPLVVWAEEYGINNRTVMSRLRWGWDLERALTQPLRITAATGENHGRQSAQ